MMFINMLLYQEEITKCYFFIQLIVLNIKKRMMFINLLLYQFYMYPLKLFPGEER